MQRSWFDLYVLPSGREREKRRTHRENDAVVTRIDLAAVSVLKIAYLSIIENYMRFKTRSTFARER